MKTISIKDLHDKTGHWLRRVKAEGELIVTERGTPVARMLPPTKVAAGNPFARRKLLRGVAATGVGMLVSSSENEELIQLCDRILVMFRGRIVVSLTATDADLSTIARYAGGHL